MSLKHILTALAIGSMPLITESAERPKTALETYPQLHNYNTLLIKEMNLVNRACAHIEGYVPFSDYDARIARALLLKEGNGYAWHYDPAQISNRGDCALSELKRPKKHRNGILEFVDDSNLKGFQTISHARRRNGRWDYSPTNITPELSIRGMWFWLAQNKYKVLKFLEFQRGLYTYKVKPGDSLWKIGRKIGIVVPEYQECPDVVKGLFQKWNPRDDLTRLHKGDMLNFQTSIPNVRVLTRSRSDMLKGYNGGGHKRTTGRTYPSAVFAIVNLLANEPINIEKTQASNTSRFTPILN